MPDECARDAVQSDLVQRFRRLVDNCLEFDQVRDYADKLRVTPGHLNDVVRARSVTTASAMIDARLLLEAKRLLLHEHHEREGIGLYHRYERPGLLHTLVQEARGRVCAGGVHTAIRDRYK